MKVKCASYALGFLDDIKLENKFQQCVNDYQAQGYVVLDAVPTDSDSDA
ncbi:hypothetical protein [Shewanella metallivivens]|uniref:DUF4177 domain-containing protein n=1 Tax=Shewanella metallivivens TaxID=2872342 RepID=A0ABT5TGP0_9GAMM|nr:hypothetical protein [Shewanella metallivivens]MDD8057778.1 hypothetical protein [Shewanella metallivivens]